MAVSISVQSSEEQVKYKRIAILAIASVNIHDINDHEQAKLWTVKVSQTQHYFYNMHGTLMFCFTTF